MVFPHQSYIHLLFPRHKHYHYHHQYYHHHHHHHHHHHQDLGHGPFSHVFDGVLIPRKYKGTVHENWKHEEQSVKLFKYLLEVNKIELRKYGLTELDQLFIEEVIIGVKEVDRKGRGNDKFYLYDIVNNMRSGLDVDKLDYFQRDMYHTNVKFQSSESFKRFIESGRVMPAAPIGDERSTAKDVKLDGPMMMCYPQKMVNGALEFFQTRFKMHNTVYTHKVVKAIEYMYTDAILLADPYINIMGSKTVDFPLGKKYKITECIFDAEAYSHLDDSVITLIKNSEIDEPDMLKAKQILERIEKRQLYKCVGKLKYERDVPDRNGKNIFVMTEDEIKTEILETKIVIQSYEKKLLDDDEEEENNNEVEYAEVSNCGFEPISSSDSLPLDINVTADDVIIEKWHTHHGQKDKNPVSNLRFFVPKDFSNVGVHLKESKYDNCQLPRSFEMFAVRVFVKDREKIETVRRKFHSWCILGRNESPTQYASSQPDNFDDNGHFDRLTSSQSQ